MKKLFYLLILLLCASCVQEDDEIMVTPVASFLQPAIPDKSDTLHLYEMPVVPIAILGCGYDAMDIYLSPNAIKKSVIDLNKVPEGRKTYGRASFGYSSTVKGANAEDYLKNLVKVSGARCEIDGVDYSDMLFAGTLKKHAPWMDEYAYSSQYSFSSCESFYHKMRLTINLDSKYIIPYLTDDFKRSIESLQPDMLVEEFGTHVLTEVLLGACVRGTYRSFVFGRSEGMHAKIAEIGGIDRLRRLGFSFGIFSSEQTKENIAKNIGGELIVELWGGESFAVFPVLDEKMWLNSVNEDNLGLTGINWDYAIPIYELISDPAKREQVKAAVVRHIDEHKLVMLRTVPMLQSIDKNGHLYFSGFEDYFAKEIFSLIEAPVCSVYEEQREGTSPLYLYSNGASHYLSLQQCPEGIKDGWSYQHVFGYVYAEPMAGMKPLYRLCNGLDYCYTIQEQMTSDDWKGWTNEGVVCYVPEL